MSSPYSKAEILEIFRSEDIDLIRSLINKERIKNLEFEVHEKVEIARNLKISLVDIIDEPDDFHGYNFKPLYFTLFGNDYVKALLKLVGEEFKGFEYHFMWIWNLNKYSMPILRAKVQGSLSELQFTNKNEFCLIVSIIGCYFGSKELLHFLNNTNHFDVFYTVTPSKDEGIEYLLEVTLIQVALAIIDHIKSNNVNDQNAAKKLHQQLMRLLRHYFTEEKRSDNVKVIYSLLNYLSKRNQLPLISSTIKSIPQKILHEFLDNPRMKNLNEIIKKALK